MKYGLLDPMPLDNGEIPRVLKCEECGMEFRNQDAENEDEWENYLNVDETGVCLDCEKLKS